MRKTDSQTLEQIVTDDIGVMGERFGDAIGSRVAEMEALSKLLADDLDVQGNGVGWWASQPDADRCVYISDHLISASETVASNLEECGLHLWEALDALDQIERHVARVYTVDRQIKWPKHKNALDLLPNKLLTLHVAGFFRSVGSVLDTLAATTIGTAGMPIDILKADFKKVRDWLGGRYRKNDARHALHTTLAAAIDAAVCAAGPSNWLEWADSYRNMYVHRGRRTELIMLEKEALILNAQSRPIPKVKPVPLLLQRPGVSDLHEMKAMAFPTLSEDARGTMRAVLESVRFLTRATAKELASIWTTRRSSPSLLVQPKEQWPDLLPADPPFKGYEPGTVKASPTVLIVSPSAERRLAASGLAKPKR
jgi:hypothetical protein